jgi:hypothetical protein
VPKNTTKGICSIWYCRWLAVRCMLQPLMWSSSGRVYNGVKNIKDERKDETATAKVGKKCTKCFIWTHCVTAWREIWAQNHIGKPFVGYSVLEFLVQLPACRLLEKDFIHSTFSRHIPETSVLLFLFSHLFSHLPNGLLLLFSCSNFVSICCLPRMLDDL